MIPSATTTAAAGNQAAAAPPRRHVVLIMPYAGTHSPVGDAGKRYDLGFHTGTLVGGRLGENWSLNGDATFDWLNPSNSGAAASVTDILLTIALAPLFHLPLDRMQLVVGPEIGWYVEDAEGDVIDPLDPSGKTHVTASSHGYLFGAQAGLLFNLGSAVKLGGLVGFSYRRATQACAQISNESESCTGDVNGASFTTINVAVAAMF